MPATRQKVLLGMSGGVDSSVAAFLLLDAGYDVTGVFLCLGSQRADGRSRACCSPEDAADARRVADRLGIDLFVLDFADAFARIVDDFLDEYAAGRTPNPCVLCNARIKFGRLVHRADSLGIRHVATGHHARIAAGPRGAPCVARGRARRKDQSYALFAVPRQNLTRMLLPVGELDDKSRVREIARSLDLYVHDKPDSQEICFVPDDDYVALLRARRPAAMRAGPVVDAAGEVLGAHDGYGQFTVGQRRGLRVAAGAPMYVLGIDPATATVTIGPREQTESDFLVADGANWHCDPPAEAFDAVVQVRYNHAGQAARVRVTGPGTFEVRFHEPVHAVAPGQAAVVYDGDRLLGGGWIRRDRS